MEPRQLARAVPPLRRFSITRVTCPRDSRITAFRPAVCSWSLEAVSPILAIQSSSPAPRLESRCTLNGASITVVVGGVTTLPALYYTSPGQLAAVLPAATPIGTGTLTVTYKGVTSSPATIQVVPSAIGINTYNGSGVATDATTGALLTYINSGSPGQNIVLWTTGLGVNSADSDTTFTSTPHAGEHAAADLLRRRAGKNSVSRLVRVSGGESDQCDRSGLGSHRLLGSPGGRDR